MSMGGGFEMDGRETMKSRVGDDAGRKQCASVRESINKRYGEVLYTYSRSKILGDGERKHLILLLALCVGSSDELYCSLSFVVSKACCSLSSCLIFWSSGAWG